MVLFLLSCNTEERRIGQRLGCSILSSCSISICALPNIGSNIHIRSFFVLIWKRNVLSTIDLPWITYIADGYFALCIF